jgi:hypothetical protein
MNKRHAKPTAAANAARTYRKVLAMNAQLEEVHYEVRGLRSAANQNAATVNGIQLNLNGALRTITDHCSRLLREKETLAKQVQSMVDSEKMASKPGFLGSAFGATNPSWDDRMVTRVQVPLATHVVDLHGHTQPDISEAEKAQELEERRAYANLMRGINPHSHAMRAVQTVTDAAPSRKCICGWAENKRFVHADDCPCR